MSTEEISVATAAARMGLTGARVRQLLKAGLLPGATRSNPGSRYRGEWTLTVPMGEAPKRSAPYGK